MTVALLCALPWILFPLVVALMVRRRPALEDWAVPDADGAPSVAVIIPARDEAHNLGPCLDRVLESTYPRLGVIVVDDGSTDGTPDVARRYVRHDPRVRLVTAGSLPNGWFGKPWACMRGAEGADADMLLFIDADVRLEPEAVGRAVAALNSTESDLLSGLPRQILLSLAERVVMPIITALILLRYPDPARVNRSRRTRDKIAVGGFLLVRRGAYEAVGGHASVRAKVAEDLGLGQRMHSRGRRVTLVSADRFVGVRMYASFPEIVEGWSKNVAIASGQTVPGSLRRATPWLLVSWVLVFWVAPPLVLIGAGVAALAAPVLVWSGVATAASLIFWVVAYHILRLSPAHALLYPLGALAAAGILLRSAVRGETVEWKGRRYRAGPQTVEVEEG